MYSVFIKPRASGFICPLLTAFPVLPFTSNKNIHFEMILDVGIGEKRKETRFLI